MATTDLTIIEKGTYLALDRPLAEIRDVLDETLAGQDLGEFDLPRVKIPAGGGGHWTIPSALGDESDTDLAGIVVHFKRTRAYWTNPDPTGEPPACRSDDTRVGVGTPGGVCKTCPLSQFGSSPKGDGQACHEKEVWFLLRPGSFLPLVLSLPAMSLKGAKQYRVALGSGGVRLSEVVTTIGLRKERGPSGDYGVAVPRVGAKLSPEDAAAARAYADELKPIFEQAAAAIATETAEGGTGYVADAPVAATAAAAAVSDVTPAGDDGLFPEA